MLSQCQADVIGFWQKCCCPSPTTPFRSAVAGGLLSCLAIEEVLELSFVEPARKDLRLRAKLFSRLKDEAERDPTRVRDSIVRTLLARLGEDAEPFGQLASAILEELYDAMPRQVRDSIIQVFLLHQRPGVRRRAYRLLRRDWREKWRPAVEKCWRLWGERQCALVIVDHFETGFLRKNLDPLTKGLRKGNEIARLYVRVCREHRDALGKLRRLDGVTYLYVCARLGLTVTEAVARRILEQSKGDTRRGIVAWSLGKLNQRALITELAAEIEFSATGR